MKAIRTLTTCLATVCILLAAASSVAANEIVVLKSSDLTSYNDAIVAFKTNCSAEYREFNMEQDVDKGRSYVARINEIKPDLVLAVGRHAARIARLGVNDEIPVVFAMVLNPQRDDLKTDSMTGISLEIPVRVQLSALKAIVPRAKKIGVIFNPSQMNELVVEARETAKELDLELIASRVDQPEDTPRALRAFASGIDAFWLIPDPTVVTPQAFRAILEFSQKDNVPFFAYNDAFVKAGALLSLGPNPSTIGGQACQMARQIFAGTSPADIPITSPQGLELFLNMRTSEQLGLTSIAANAMSFSAREGVRINVTQ